MRREPQNLNPRVNKTLLEIVQSIRREVVRRFGSNLTFEQRRDAAVAVSNQALWLNEEQDLWSLVTNADEVCVEGTLYRRLEQPSSADYRGRWSAHHVEEPLYRLQGVRNGPTIKPVELRAGIVERMTPDLARIVGQLSSEHTSRQLVSTLSAVGLVPPSRAPLEKQVKRMAAEMSEQVDELEQTARDAEAPPAGVAAVSCGMDRGAVRMVEPLDPAAIAQRISADVAWVAKHYPSIDLHCIQDGAPELRVLPRTLGPMLPANMDVQITDLVDFKHLLGYLDDVVDTCEPPGDPRNKKDWYRNELLRDDGAIDRIWRKLKDLSKSIPKDKRKERNKRKAVAAALSYIRTRKNRMRYASLHKQGLPIGSGDTENTVWLMQQRVKRPAQAWGSKGLRGVLVLRALVHS